MIKQLKRNIYLDYINTFITNLNMQSSIWVLYLTYCNMSLMQIGLLEGIYHITSMICEIPSGAWADMFGRKKSMLLSRICITLSCIIMLFSRNFYGFALSFIVQAFGNSLNSGSEEALVYDSMKYINEEDHYMKVNGRINMIIEVSQAIATVVGGILAEYSYVWCYAACVVIAILSLLPVFFMEEPPILEESEMKGFSLIKKHFQTCVEILKGDIRILKIITYYSMIFAAHTLLFFYSQQYFYDLGYNKIEISIVFLFAGIMSCFGALASEKLYERWKNGVATISAIVIAITLVCFGFQKSTIAIGTFIVSCFFNAVLYPAQSESLNRLIPSQQRATLISVSSMFFSLTMIVLFPIAGYMADLWNLPQVLMVIGVLILGVVIISDKKEPIQL